MKTTHTTEDNKPTFPVTWNPNHVPGRGRHAAPPPAVEYPEPLLPNDVGVAYILWVLTGIFGGHRYYLGRKGSGAAMTIMSLLLVGLPVTVVWAVVDAFLIPGMFRDALRK